MRSSVLEIGSTHGKYLVRLLEAAGGTVEFLSTIASSICPLTLEVHLDMFAYFQLWNNIEISVSRFLFLSDWVRYMLTKFHAHKRCWTLRKTSISTRKYAEIQIQKPIFDNKKNIWKILVLKIQTAGTCSSASFIHRTFYFWETLKSLNFWWYFKVPQANCLMVNFGRFG